VHRHPAARVVHVERRYHRGLNHLHRLCRGAAVTARKKVENRIRTAQHGSDQCVCANHSALRQAVQSGCAIIHSRPDAKQCRVDAPSYTVGLMAPTSAVRCSTAHETPTPVRNVCRRRVSE
jgi:hypothetical protein